MMFAGSDWLRLAKAAGALILAALASTPGFALSDGKQLMTGGGTFADPGTAFTSPGLAYVYGPDAFGTNTGERASQLVMQPGTLSGLRVRVLTQRSPSSGALAVTVRINGADTSITCSTAGTATCHTAPATTVAVPNNSRLTVKIVNTFVGAGNLAFTYSFVFD